MRGRRGGRGDGDKRRVYLHVPRANLRREGIGFKATLSVPFCAITSLGIVFAALLASLRSFLFRNMCIRHMFEIYRRAFFFSGPNIDLFAC